MATATVVKAWKDGGRAYLALRVAEGGARGNVEYLGSVALEELAGLTAAQQKAALVAAVKGERDGQLAAPADLGIAGTVTV